MWNDKRVSVILPTYNERENVRRLIEHHVETRAIGPTAVKGLSEPLEVYRLVRSLNSSSWQARASRGLTNFTGRERELEELHLLHDQLNDELQALHATTLTSRTQASTN